MTSDPRRASLSYFSCLLGVGLLLTGPDSQARDLYVATDGTDDSSGTENEPWRTIDRATASAEAGDTVYIRAGTYGECLVPQASGSADAPLVFTAYPGEAVTLDGTGLSGQGVVYLNGVQHIQISGLEVVNASEAGIWIIDSSYVTISNNRTYNTVSSGIIVSEFGVNDHIYIDSNEVELACNDGGQECISISQCDVFEVTRNHVHHGGPGTNGGEGIDAKFGSSNGVIAYNYVHHLSRQGLYADAWSVATHDLEYYGNIVHDCQFGLGAASEQGGELYNISFHDNLVYDTGGPGMYILMSAGPLYDIWFVNNTIHHTGYEWGSGLWLNGPDAEHVIVRNNIFSGLSGEPFFIEQVPASWTLDHNLAEVAQSGYTDGFIIGAPGYVDADAADFHLLSSSPAVDSGSADTGYSTALGDLEQSSRVTDGDCSGTAEVDLGAFELPSPCGGGAGGSAGASASVGTAGADAATGGTAAVAGASSASGGDGSGGAPTTGGTGAAGGTEPSDAGATSSGSGGAGAAPSVSGAGGSLQTGGASAGALTSGGATGGSTAAPTGPAGGAAVSSAAGAAAEGAPAAEEDGCGCRVAGCGVGPSSIGWSALLSMLGLARRRRRTRT